MNGGLTDSAGLAPSDGQFMEYAVDKNFDIFPDGSGKLLMPGAKLAWEYHTHPAKIEHDVTAHAEMALYFYPKGVTPRYRIYHMGLQANQSALGGERTIDIPPNTIFETQGFTVLQAPARIDNFQPHMHLPARPWKWMQYYRTARARCSLCGSLQLQLDDKLHLCG